MLKSGSALIRMGVQVYGKKPTLQDIRERHYFDSRALAESAGVDLSVIHRMLNSQPVQPYQAELVLAALSDDSGENYTLETVSVVLSSGIDDNGA